MNIASKHIHEFMNIGVIDSISMTPMTFSRRVSDLEFGWLVVNKNNL